MRDKNSFIQLALDHDVLQFGQFTLKSGRQSPYFFNAGLFYQGGALRELGRYYADLLIHHQVQSRQLFGPAYKGLPLATSTAIALAEQGLDVTVTFNRKEVKDHGEGGQLIGAPLVGDIVIIDDVITAGTAFREAEQIIKAQQSRVSTVVIALDRCERGVGAHSTLDEIKAQGIQVLSIITIHDVIAYLEQHHEDAKAEQIRAYLV